MQPTNLKNIGILTIVLSSVIAFLIFNNAREEKDKAREISNRALEQSTESYRNREPKYEREKKDEKFDQRFDDEREAWKEYNQAKTNAIIIILIGYSVGFFLLHTSKKKQQTSSSQ